MNLHLQGQETGKTYGSYFSFFQVDLPDIIPHFRLFSISDITTNQVYTNLKIGSLSTNNQYLDLEFNGINAQSISTQDIQANPYTETNAINAAKTMPTENNCGITQLATIQNNQHLQQTGANTAILTEENVEYLRTQHNEKELIPFQYKLFLEGTAREKDNKLMQLDIIIDCIKKPLLVGGNGKIHIGNEENYSYYYILPKCDVIGTITLDGLTEQVTGTGWMDHQWGDFFSTKNPIGLPVQFEWFSITTDGYGELLTGNCWWRDTGELINDPYANGLHWYHPDGSLEIFDQYTIEHLEIWNDSFSNKKYAVQWKITEPTNEICLTINACFNNQMMRGSYIEPINKFLLALAPGSSFWEGSCLVTGTIGNQQISGKAFVESTHPYTTDDEHPGNNPNILQS